jgi:hypothetical protein
VVKLEGHSLEQIDAELIHLEGITMAAGFFKDDYMRFERYAATLRAQRQRRAFKMERSRLTEELKGLLKGRADAVRKAKERLQEVSDAVAELWPEGKMAFAFSK